MLKKRKKTVFAFEIGIIILIYNKLSVAKITDNQHKIKTTQIGFQV